MDHQRRKRREGAYKDDWRGGGTVKGATWRPDSAAGHGWWKPVVKPGLEGGGVGLGKK